MCGVVIAMTCSCEFRQERGTMRRTQPYKTAGRLGAVNTAASHYRPAKEACMSISPHCTMPLHGCKNSNLYFGANCAIISGVSNPHNATVARADNTNDCLTSSVCEGDDYGYR